MNQRFRVKGNQILVKGDSESHEVDYLVLDAYDGQLQSGAKVGIYKKHGGLNQKWILVFDCK